ncbi:MAG: histidine phosphatase family protein [Actinomycetes bacterium]
MTNELHAAGGIVPEEPGRRLVLLRHGRTAWNAEGRAQGHADVPLDDVGHRQAAAVAPYVASLGPAALWTSDLARARETCSYLERATGLEATSDPRLREFDVGLRQGLTVAEFEATEPQAHAAWLRGHHAAVPGAEDGAAVRTRMLPALRSCLDALGAGETGVVVTHGACLKVAVVALLGWPEEIDTSLRGMDNCAWVTLEELGLGGRLRLAGYNESVRPGHDAPVRLPDEM